MVGHSQFSRDTTSTPKTKLWDPSKTLGIINTDPGYESITCVGHAPTKGRRCRISLRADNREFITDTLNDIAYLRPDSPTVLSRLRAIAGPALCVRYHQGQAGTVVTQWQKKIQQLNPQVEERKPQRVKAGKKQESGQDQSVEDLQEQLREMRELLAKFQEEFNSQRHQDRGPGGQEEQAAKNRQEEERKRRKREETEREARRQEKERLEKERLEKERLKKERLDKEKREREENESREREQAASNERIRQRAQKRREEREREKREKEQKERQEWDQLWTKYQERWVHFRDSASSREGSIRDAIPWPVKSGSYRDVKNSNVKEFLQMAVPRDANVAKLMKKECLKWHPDTIHTWLRGSQLTDVDRMMVDMICRVITGLLDSYAGRSAECLG
jgi:hypothetical protein